MTGRNNNSWKRKAKVSFRILSLFAYVLHTRICHLTGWRDNLYHFLEKNKVITLKEKEIEKLKQPASPMKEKNIKSKMLLLLINMMNLEGEQMLFIKSI